MKKIYYLLAFIAVAAVSCKPLDKTYKDINATPLAKKLTVNLIASDYALLSTTIYANKSANFNSATDANLYVPTILAAKYPTASDLTAASVTFALAPASSSIAAPDLTLAHIAIVLGPTDYIFPGNTFANFSATTALNYLAYKYPTPSANQMVVMTYNYFETGVTASAGTLTTDTFVYLNSNWTKLYSVSPAQYSSVNRGTNNSFVTADVANLAYYLNNFLLADQTVMATAKTGDVKYVSYKFNSTTQMVLTLTYTGSSWVPKQTLSYLKLSGIWVPDPTIYVNEPAVKNNPDYVYLQTTTIGSDLARAGTANYGDFELRTGNAAAWLPTEIPLAIAAILLHKFPTPTVGVPYNVTYVTYPGSSTTVSSTFLFNGTAFVPQ